MKLFSIVIALVHGACALSAMKSVGGSFGPHNCVSLTRSSVGSCVISTNCEGLDISGTEFSFDCVGQNGKADVVRHSFGVGGFEANEEFDTEVKCRRCAAVGQEASVATPAKEEQPIVKPAPVLVMPTSPPAPKHVEKREDTQQVVPGAVGLRAESATAVQGQAKFWPFTSGKKEEKAPDAVRYGPAGCVSVYKNPENSHCIMSTDDCVKEDLKDYEFGLVCVGKNGSPVKHLFGKDSFDSKETFDTLITCEQCLGLEDIPDTVVMAGEVATMAKEVSALKDVMKNISINVQMLNKKVFPSSGPAPAPAGAPPAPAKPAKFLVHGAVSHYKHRHHHHGNLRHSHKKHHRRHRREEDDDDDYDDDEERDDGREESEESEEDRGNHWDASEEEPSSSAVQDVAVAADQINAAKAAKLAEEARVQYTPMNQVSSLQQAKQQDDDEDDSEDGSDED